MTGHPAFRRCLRVLSLALVVLSACTGSTPVPTVVPPGPATGTPAPNVLHLDTSVCPWSLPEGWTQGQNADCGFLTVAEKHGARGTGTIRLAVARFRRQPAAADPNPIIYLADNPAALDADIFAMGGPFGLQVTSAHDFVILAGRGTGKSEPALDCPEYQQQILEDYTQPLDAATDLAHAHAALLRCRDRLGGQKIDLSAYNATESAADINDLRMALGYNQINLLGVSGGSRVALEVVGANPQSVRSVVLDSVVPPQVGTVSAEPRNVAHALELDLNGCAEQGACPSGAAAVQGDLAVVSERLNAQPVTIEGSESISGTPSLVVTGSRLVTLLASALRDPGLVEEVPALIEGVKDDETGRLADFVRRALPGQYAGAQALEYSLLCNDSAPYDDQKTGMAGLVDLPAPLRDVYTNTLPATFKLCGTWPHVKPTARKAVSGDQPALILQSANDPVAPPENARVITGTLTHAFYVETPGIGHGVTPNGGTCAWQVILDFFANPDQQPDTSCIAGLGVEYR